MGEKRIRWFQWLMAEKRNSRKYPKSLFYQKCVTQPFFHFVSLYSRFTVPERQSVEISLGHIPALQIKKRG